MYYFAYGSNMSLLRLRSRVPSARSIGCFLLEKYDLRFHKSSKDGSGKCDAYFTSNPNDSLYGVLFDINSEKKDALDRAEGLGYGYTEKEVTIFDNNGSPVTAITYVATNIDQTLRPYSWYLEHVLIGAAESSLPTNYIKNKISCVDSIEDENNERATKERSIYK